MRLLFNLLARQQSVVLLAALAALAALACAGWRTSDTPAVNSPGGGAGTTGVSASTAGRLNDKVSKANHERIDVGMTRKDVEALLGPGKDLADNDPLITPGLRKPDRHWVAWPRDASDVNAECILVAFAPDGKLVSKVYRTRP
jgi:hypothetical protein